jgi:hypothetical protein
MRNEIFEEIKKSRETYLCELLRPVSPPPETSEKVIVQASGSIKVNESRGKVRPKPGVVRILVRYLENFRTVIIPQFFELSKE